MIEFIERTGKRKNGKPTIKTHRHWLAPCDQCGRALYLPTARLGLKCRMTPKCPGKHRKPEVR